MNVCLCIGIKCFMLADDARHGTANGYGNLGCRCEPCRAAHAESLYARKSARKSAPTPEHVHGSANGYGNYGCRCGPCSDAWAEDGNDRARRRRRGLTDVQQGLRPGPQWRSPERPHQIPDRRRAS